MGCSVASRPAIMLLAAAVFSAALTSSAGMECGVLMPETDIPGRNLPGTPTREAGPEACQARCESTATCNAYIIFPDGACYLKSVDVDTVEPIPRRGMSSSLLCQTSEPSCGVLMPETDIPGRNMFGSPTMEAGPEACQARCESTATCNAYIIFPNGACFLKSVDVDTVQPIPRPGMSSYLFCQTPEPTCGVLMPETDIPGRNLPGTPTREAGPEACQARCESTATCNAYIIFPDGACYLKSIDVDTVEPIPRRGMSSYLFCGGGTPPPSGGAAPSPSGGGTPPPSECAPNGDASECPATDTPCKNAICDSTGKCSTENVETLTERCDINASGDGFCFQGECVFFNTCTADDLGLCSSDSIESTCLEPNCQNIDPATGFGECENIPKSPLPGECSSKLQQTGVCAADGSCNPAPCNPALNGADCTGRVEIFSTCAIPICTEDGLCDFEPAPAGTACVPAFPEGSTEENGVCNGLICFGPGQCQLNFRDQCPTPENPCEFYGCVGPFLPVGVDADIEPFIGTCKISLISGPVADGGCACSTAADCPESFTDPEACNIAECYMNDYGEQYCNVAFDLACQF